MHIEEMIHATDMYTSTGHRLWLRSVHAAQTKVDTMANAVMPDG